MNNEPLVSIIMNCYNSDRHLEEAIESVYAQTYKNWEIIFWDNASIDSSAEIANSYDGRLKYFLAEDMAPLGEARNFAMRKATGKYIAFLDCDDLYLPEKLDKQVSQMEEGRVDFCYASAVVIDDEGIEINRHITKNNSGYLFGSLLRQYDINMQSAMVRHDLLLDNKITFDLSLKYSPDYNLFMKIAAIAYTGVLRECLVKYRMTGASLTAKSYNLIYNERKYTLDLLCRHSELFIRNRTSFDYAFNMLNYYEAIKYISTGEYVLARACFRKVLNIKWKYTIFYLLLFLPLSPSFFLKSFFK